VRDGAEQAALRRVATLVAREGEHGEVVAAVAEEVGKLLPAEAAGVVRFEPAGHGTVVGTWSRSGVPPLPVGAEIELNAETAVGRVHGTGRPARTAGFEGAEGSLPQRLTELGYRSSLAAPIYVDGRLWGALAAADVREEPLAEGSEQRLARFSELVAQALANADAREQLAASRARLVEASDAERRRLERNLHDGAQQRLDALALTIRLAQNRLAGDPDEVHGLLDHAADELTAALVELREIARGIHPAILSERGLAAALRGVVERAPVSVELEAVRTSGCPSPSRLPLITSSRRRWSTCRSTRRRRWPGWPSPVSATAWSSRSPMTGSAVPISPAAQASVGSPTGSARSEGRSSWTAAMARVRRSTRLSPAAQPSFTGEDRDIGVGHIGHALTVRFVAAGREVMVSNSRVPDPLDRIVASI
jgi:signal transduction histidine kinase